MVLKAKGKVFVFLGRRDEEKLRFSVKLPQSGDRVLDQPWAEPTGYGLGKSGWVTLSFDSRDVPADAELCKFVEESYRAVAQKTLVKELDGRGVGGSSRPTAAKASAKLAAKTPAKVRKKTAKRARGKR